MHLDITDDQAIAVVGSLHFSRSFLVRFLKSGKGSAEKIRWATERISHIDAILVLMDEHSS